MAKLTPKQERFIGEYLIDFNATQAAIRAGYSEATAKVIGYENLTKPYIQEIIKQRMNELSEKVEVTQERVIEEYAKIAFLDPSLFFDGEGNLIPITKLSKSVSATIAGIDQVKRVTRREGEDAEIEYTKKIKVSDKIKALDSLSRHLGLFEKDNSQKRPLAVLYDSIDPEVREALNKAYKSILQAK